eukprot:TRINITY_DN3942_c0_g1_i1.p1 TRINITY_DN3942_c0_g1~~TRINITY_DN3942_c0_g1_i1.p1  ORF type:complete len:968 (-),score=323.57 TRINITY_DN3942_c0_g1_i1:521-3424(-)
MAGDKAADAVSKNGAENDALGTAPANSSSHQEALVNPDTMTVAQMRKYLSKLGKTYRGSKQELAQMIRGLHEDEQQAGAQEGAKGPTPEGTDGQEEVPSAVAGQEAVVEVSAEVAAEPADGGGPPSSSSRRKRGGVGSGAPDKMTVAELRAYLSKSGQSQDGTKAVLLARIKALQATGGDGAKDSTESVAEEGSENATATATAPDGSAGEKAAGPGVTAEGGAPLPAGAASSAPEAKTDADGAEAAAALGDASAEAEAGAGAVSVDPAAMTVMQMRRHLAALHLPTTGKKAELEERIRQGQAGGAAASTSPSAGAKRKEPSGNQEAEAEAEEEAAEKKGEGAAEGETDAGEGPEGAVPAGAQEQEQEADAVVEAAGGRAKRQRNAAPKAAAVEEKSKAEEAGRRKRGKGAKGKATEDDEAAKAKGKDEDAPPAKKSKGKKAQAAEAKEEDEAEEEKAVEEEEEQKAVVATKVGKAVLDLHLPAHLKDKAHVVEQGEDIYDAVLNQTNTNANNNKFYVIQLLRVGSSPWTQLFCRWGRVGVPGQQSLATYPSKEQGIQEFEKKFFDKTKNFWAQRHKFEPHAGKYTMLEMDYSAEPEEGEEDKGKAATAKKVESKLDPRVLELVNLICDADMFQREMCEIGYDAKKLPLGKLSRKTILQGYSVLKLIAAELDARAPSMDKLSQLSSDFFTVIPHDFGFKKMREFIIRDKQTLKKKLEMVEALAEIEVAAKVMKGPKADADKEPVHPADEHYERLQCQMEPLEEGSEEMKMVKAYLKNTHASTHSYYKLEVEQAYRVKRQGEDERFKKLPNRQLLWHGSRLTNWTGILSQGLRIAPPEAPSTGYMFGKGVYFADMVSKSANYCYASVPGTGLLLLCEVALGEPRELTNADYDAANLPAGKHSTKGVGCTAPDPASNITLEDGVLVPLGPGKIMQQPDGGYRALLYNEYIVYSVDQIRMRYLLKCHFGKR